MFRNHGCKMGMEGGMILNLEVGEEAKLGAKTERRTASIIREDERLPLFKI